MTYDICLRFLDKVILGKDVPADLSVEGAGVG